MINCQNKKDNLPIIDMHLHATSVSSDGPPCETPKELPYFDPSKDWSKTFTEWYSNPKYKNPVSTDKDLMDQTLAVLKRRNIYAMTCGNLLDDYIKNGGQRIIPGLSFSMSYGGSPQEIKKLLSSGKYKVFGEIGIQYDGISPSDSIFEPYLKIAEELDIPMGIHMGTGPPGAPYLTGLGKYRARLNSPLLIEEALVRHPKLRVYIMHAGWPMTDDLIALLWDYPQVYVDVGMICYAIPRPEFYAYLKRIVEAGFGKRVMFGSDQMNWPCSIESGIEAIEQAEFLSEDQKRDILYLNAARFLRLSNEEISRQYSK
jgi:predicted TIM-barrel fold metal-dependent hydrolase